MRMGEDYLLKSRLVILKDIGVKILLIVAILTSTWYAFWVEKTNIQTFQALYTWFTQEYTSVNFISFSYVVTKYLKKLLLVWLLGWFGPTIPLSWILLFGVIFSYGFTTTSLVLLLGSKGILVGMFSYGIQSVLLLSVGFEILKKSIDLGQKGKGNAKKHYIQLLIPLVGGSVIMALLDLGVVNIFKIFFK